MKRLELLLINFLTSILSSILIVIGVFCFAWYLTMQEFPPNMDSVVDKWWQYRQTLKVGQQAIEKIRQSTLLKTQTPGNAKLDPAETQAKQLNAQVNAQTEKLQQQLLNQVNTLSVRLLKLEQEVQLLKAQKK